MKIITEHKSILSFFLVLSLFLQGCRVNTGAKSITRSGFFFDTLVNITIYDTDDETLLDECFDLCDDYEHMLSITLPGSDISRINTAGTEAVTVSSDTAILISEAGRYFDLSKGKLDITIAPLSMLWTEARNDQIPPSDSGISALLPHIGFDKITLDPNNSAVSKSDPRTMLDTGALAKGYIADRLKEHLVRRGVRSAIISLGGNITTIGTKPDGSPFKIGIRKPFGQAEEAVAALNINDLSVVTSGIYERCFTFDNRLYHHILDPSTGYPEDTDLYSATIICPSSLDGDALSTICLLYGLEDAEELINNTPGTEAVFITRDNRLHYTGGAKVYINN